MNVFLAMMGWSEVLSRKRLFSSSGNESYQMIVIR